MTKDEAIAWVVEKLSGEFHEEYYVDKAEGTKAAQVMTALTGNRWIAQPTKYGVGWAVIPKP